MRINGQLVALKVIRMKTEEGVPFTAIREGQQVTCGGGGSSEQLTLQNMFTVFFKLFQEGN